MAIYLKFRAPLLLKPTSQFVQATPLTAQNKLIGSANLNSVAAKPNEPLKNEPDTNQQKAYIAAFLTPISFWGQVVDEKTNPIRDAVIKVEANNNPNPMGKGASYELKSGPDGLFSITGIRGIALSIDVSKGGYYATKQSSGLVSYVVKGHSDIPVPTSEKPAIFVLKKKGVAAALIRADGGINMPKNGNPIWINLKNAKATTSELGDIEVECWVHDEGVNTAVYNRYGWECKIIVPGGGIIERTDTLNFSAPSDGYQAFDEINMPKTAHSWKPQMTKDYFLKMHDGCYARLQIRIVTGANNFLRIISYLNPQPGSKNLEYDMGAQSPVQ